MNGKKIEEINGKKIEEREIIVSIFIKKSKIGANGASKASAA